MKKTIHFLFANYMCIRFPFLYPRNVFTGKHYNNWKLNEKIIELSKSNNKFTLYFYLVIQKLLEWTHFIPHYSTYDAIPYGWRKAFGMSLCKEIKEAIKYDNKKYGKKGFPHIISVKEKFGELRIDFDRITEEVNRILQKYEYISFHTCIICGKTAPYLTEGYILPYCYDCAPDGTKEREKFYEWSHSNYSIKGSTENFTYNRNIHESEG